MTSPVLPASPRHLVVRLPNPAGDVVAATPALRALRAALPSTRITWCARPPALELLDGLDERDDVMAIEGALARGFFAPRRVGLAWRAAGADAVLLLTNTWRSARAARVSGAATRVGHVLSSSPGPARALLPLSRRAMLTHPIEPPRENGRVRPEPMRTWYLRLVAPFGAIDDGSRAALAVTAHGEALALRRLSSLPDSSPFFAVSPGAAYGPSKMLPVARVVEVVRALRDRTRATPLVLGGPGEDAIVADVAAGVGSPCLSTAGNRAGWSETKALLARASLLLTPDAGPRHVAAALGTPVVVWMGPTDPRWSAGDDATTTVVRREDLPCLGCHLKACPIAHPCLEGLDAGRIIEAAAARIRRPSRGG